MIAWLSDLVGRVAGDVWGMLAADWPYLLLSVLVAAALSVYVGTDRLARWLSRRRWSAIGGSVALATLTPFCSCGTTAVVLGMLASRTPWAPIVAFMVASPLTSPAELVLAAGLFGWPFALTFFIGAAVLGIVAGAIADHLERAGWLQGQARVLAVGGAACPTDCPSSCAASAGGRPRGASARGLALRADLGQRLRLAELGRQVIETGRRLALYFVAYGSLGYLMIELLPDSILSGALGGRSLGAVVFAALLGIPLYLSTEASLPMVAGLVAGGLGVGPAMAFLVTGAGTSVGAVTGAFVIARGRVVGLTVAILFVGAVVLGSFAGLVLN